MMKQIQYLYIFLLLFVPFKNNFKAASIENIAPIAKYQISICEPYDIIINEIMEDPTVEGNQTLGLPAEEYVELYNRSQKTINLEDFSFTDGSSRIVLFPSFEMLPDSYLIIAKGITSELQDFGNYLGFSNFPTLSSNESLVLKNEFGDIIDIVNYNQDWYRNTSRANGGYSLERINPTQPCEGASNWTASTALTGGTPGKENTVLNLQQSAIPLNLLTAYPIAVDEVRLTFNKAIGGNFMEVENYQVLDNNVVQVNRDGDNPNQILLQLASPLGINQVTSIEVNTTLTDCIGNPASENQTVTVGLPVPSNSTDLLINEILFNPETGGVDFVELFNKSNNIIDVKTIVFANQSLSNAASKPVEIERLIFPEEYMVFTPSPADILNRYQVTAPNQLIRQSLPNFPDRAGNVTLFTNILNEIIIIDEFDYSEDFHTPLINDKNGISLERISPNLSTQSAANWHSAAAAIGYASPTAPNSQLLLTVDDGNTVFDIPNKRISPDGDGFEDILLINYKTEEEGFLATLHLFDLSGNLIKKLAQNELLATQGAFKWDGTTASGQKAVIGIYILWIECINSEGKVNRRKEAIVVAGKI